MAGHIVLRSRALSFSEHTDPASDIRLVNVLLCRAMNSFELQEPRSLFGLRHIIVKLRCRRSRTSRVFEDKEAVIVAVLNEFDSLFKILISLTGKTDDDVAG